MWNIVFSRRSIWAGCWIACSKRSDSGERCEVKKAMKSRGGLLFYFFALLFTLYRSPLSERLEQASCWSSLADEHNTLPKSTGRHVKLDKFIFGTPLLPNLSCKHWFASLVWNFCRWVADVPPCETSPAMKSEEKRMFSKAKYIIDSTWVGHDTEPNVKN